MRKVYWRLLPLTILCLFSCYLDRISVGFAALTMNKYLDIPFTMISTSFNRARALVI